MKKKAKTYFESMVDEITDKHYLRKYQYILIRQSKHFMEKHLSENIDLEKLAASASMSRFHYIRVFRLVYGVTPRQFLRDLRLKKAKSLLKDGISVTRTCFEVGYESLTTFSIAFKRGCGISPRKYQNLYKGI